LTEFERIIGGRGRRVNGRGPTRPAMLTEGPTPEEREAVAAHLAYLERLAAAGVVLLFGRTQTTDSSTRA